ncbi:tetratricopeptide repeat protein, partial [Solidesulfovibrio sp.]|nr:hypothetical protein [Solidesulfovibrio sp.]
MPSPAAHTASRRQALAAIGYGALLLAAFWAIAACCATPERGARLFDQGRLEEALPLLAAAAERGSVPSSHRLGLLLEKGLDGPPDKRRALALFTAGARRNHVPSQVRAGELSRSVAGDDATAARWYRKAAERGEAVAMGRLGLMLLTGAGGPADPDAALALLRRAATAGDAQAATALGQALLSLAAVGDPRGGDPADAAALFAAAAAGGDPEAQNRLADLY